MGFQTIIIVLITSKVFQCKPCVMVRVISVRAVRIRVVRVVKVMIRVVMLGLGLLAIGLIILNYCIYKLKAPVKPSIQLKLFWN